MSTEKQLSDALDAMILDGFRRDDDWLVKNEGEQCEELIHIDTVSLIVRAVIEADRKLAQEPVGKVVSQGVAGLYRDMPPLPVGTLLHASPQGGESEDELRVAARSMVSGWRDHDRRRFCAADRKLAEQVEPEKNSDHPVSPAPGAAAALPTIDYSAAISECYRTLGYARGTKGCIGFARGAEWYRATALAAAAQSTPQPNDPTKE